MADTAQPEVFLSLGDPRRIARQRYEEGGGSRRRRGADRRRVPPAEGWACAGDGRPLAHPTARMPRLRFHGGGELRRVMR